MSRNEFPSGSRTIVKCVESTNQKGETFPFCVLEPIVGKAIYGLKVRKTRDLPLLANKMHERQ